MPASRPLPAASPASGLPPAPPGGRARGMTLAAILRKPLVEKSLPRPSFTHSRADGLTSRREGGALDWDRRSDRWVWAAQGSHAPAPEVGKCRLTRRSVHQCFPSPKVCSVRGRTRGLVEGGGGGGGGERGAGGSCCMCRSARASQTRPWTRCRGAPARAFLGAQGRRARALYSRPWTAINCLWVLCIGEVAVLGVRSPSLSSGLFVRRRLAPDVVKQGPALSWSACG